MKKFRKHSILVDQYFKEEMSILGIENKHKQLSKKDTTPNVSVIVPRDTHESTTRQTRSLSLITNTLHKNTDEKNEDDKTESTVRRHRRHSLYIESQIPKEAGDQTENHADIFEMNGENAALLYTDSAYKLLDQPHEFNSSFNSKHTNRDSNIDFWSQIFIS